MSKTVDERVVEMRFDNSKFESNVKTSLNTLERLKASMNFDNASKSLDGINKAAKNISFDGIASNVSIITSRFSVLGIMGKRALENITDSMMGFARKTTKFLTSGIINGGITRAMNLENAKFQLQGLLKDGQAVADVMKNVNDAVDGTAYSLDSAAKVASQLAASGMRAGDQMFSSLRGVAGVAAMTNSSYEDIGRIFTQVAGQGRLMGQDLLQLSSRGMNAAATIATYLGKTESEVRAMVTKGQISFEIFANAMDNAFGEHAKKANETFTGAMSNVKASLARIGAEFVSPLIIQNGPLVAFFNTLRERINEVKSGIGPLAGVFSDSISMMINKLTKFLSKLDMTKPFEKFKGLNSKWDEFSAKIQEAGVSTETFQAKLKEVASEHGANLDKMIAKEGSLNNVMSSGKISKDMVIETLKRMAGAQSEAIKSTEDYTEKLAYFQDVVKKVWNGDYKNGKERIKALTEAGYDYAQVQDLVNKTIDDHTVSIEDLSDAQLSNIGYTQEEISAIRKLADEAEKAGTPLNELISSLERPSGKTLFLQGLSNILQAIIRPLKAIAQAWGEIFAPQTSEGLYNSVAAFEKFTSRLVMSEETMDKLTRTFKGLFAAMDLVGGVITGALRFGLRVICNLFGIANADILTITAYVGDAIVKFREWVKEHNLLAKAVTVVVSAITKFVKKLSEIPLVQKGLSKIIKVFSNIGKSVKQYFGDSIERFKEFIGRVKEMDGLSLDNVIRALKDFKTNVLGFRFNFGTIFDKIPDGLIGGLIRGIRSGTSKVVETVLELGSAILESICNFLGIHSPATTMIEIGQNIILGLIEGIAWGIGKLGDLMQGISNLIISSLTNTDIDAEKTGSSILDGFIKAFKHIDWGKLFVAGTLGFSILIAKDLVKVLEKLFTPLEGVNNLLSSISGVFKSISTGIGQWVKAQEWKAKSEAIFTLAKALALLSVSLYLLSKIDAKSLWSSVGALGAVSAILVALSFAVSKINNIESFGKLSILLVSLSASLLIISIAIKKLSELNFGRSLGAVLELTVIMGAIAGLMYVFGTFVTGKNEAVITKAGFMLIQMSVAIGIMAIVMRLLAGIPAGDAAKGLGLILAVEILFAAMVAVSHFAGASAARAGKMLLAMSVAIGLLAFDIRLIAGIPGSDITKGMAVILGVELLFGALIAVSAFAGKYASKAGRMLMQISVAIGILAVALKIMGGIPKSHISKGFKIISGCLLLFMGFVTLSQFAGRNAAKAGSMILKMSAAIGILALSIKLIGTISLGAIAKGLLVITAVGVVFAALVAVSTFAGANADKAGKMLLQMSISIMILSFAIAVLSFLKPSDIAVATLAIDSLILAFAALIAATGKMKVGKGAIATMITMVALIAVLAGAIVLLGKLEPGNVITATACLSALMVMFGILTRLTKNVRGSALTILSISIAIGLLAGMLYMLAGLPVKQTIGAATALSMLMLAMSISFKLIGSVSPLASGAMVGMLAMTGIVALLAIILGVLSALDVNPSLEAAAALSVLLIAMSVALNLLIGVGAAAPLALIGAGVLGTVIVAIVAVVTAIGALFDHVPMLEKFLNKGIDILIAVFKGIGKMIGSLAGGFAEGVSSSLPVVADNLSEFMKRLQPFIEGANNIDPAMAEGVKNLAVALLAITGADLLNSITAWVTGGNSLAQFGAQLVLFGQALKAYSVAVEGIDCEAISQSAAAAKALAEIDPKNTDGLISLFTGDNPLDEFGEQLKVFGQGLKSYSDSVIGIDCDAIQNSAAAAKALTEIDPKNTDGLISLFTGDNPLDEFGKQLKVFGDGLASYASSVSTIDLDAVINSVSAAKALAEINPKNMDGLLSLFAGKKDLATFGTKLSSFGTSLKSYADSVAEIDIEAVDGSIKAAKQLAKFASALDEIDDIGKVKDFGSKLKGLGTSINAFCSETSEITAGQLSGVISELKGIQKFMTDLSGFDASGVYSFKTALTNLGTVSVDGLINSLTGAYGRVQAAALGLTNAITAGVNMGKLSIVVSLIGTMNECVSIITSKTSAFFSGGLNLGVGLSNGLKTGVSTARATLLISLLDCVVALRSYYSNFNSAGFYVASGFAEGIKSGSYKSVIAAIAMANAAAEAAKKALDENSPSKVFYTIGAFIPQGMANGINHFAGLVTKSVKRMSDKAVDNAQGMVSSIGYAISNAADASIEPTIRPVLDMSEIQNGTVQLGTSFDLALNKPIEMLSNAMYGSQAEIISSNLEVADAVNGLKGEIVSGVKDAIYNAFEELAKQPAVIEFTQNVDGRQFAKATVEHYQNEVSKRATRAGRKNGIL